MGCLFNSLYAAELSIAKRPELSSHDSMVYLQNDAFSLIENTFWDYEIPIDLHNERSDAFNFTALAFYATSSYSPYHLRKLIEKNIVGKSLDRDKDFFKGICIAQIYGAVAFTMYQLFGIGLWRNSNISEADMLRRNLSQQLQFRYGPERGPRINRAIYNLGAISSGDDWILIYPSDMEVFLGYLGEIDQLHSIQIQSSPIIQQPVGSVFQSILQLVSTQLENLSKMGFLF
ncbi:MAG: hypothetical protein LBL32_02330 [Holosporales bacterium]|jgi:hypothetical protein|nr:hypothetical protein [Holosporales bacterium]